MRKLLALFLVFSLIFTLSACTRGPDTTVEPDNPVEPDGPSGPVTPDNPDTPDSPDSPEDPDGIVPPDENALAVGIGGGAAAMAAAGLYGREEYDVKLMDDPAGALSDGQVKAAVLPVSTAAQLYNSGAKVHIAAIIMSGGWEIASEGGLESIFDLAGRTVYLPEDHPADSRLFEYIATEYGFIIGDTLTVTYAPLSELADKDTAMLPSYMAQGRAPTLNLRDEWENVTGYSLFPTACLAVSAELEGEELAGFLADFGQSVENAGDYTARAVALGIARDEAEARTMAETAAFLWITGKDTVREELSGYFGTLYIMDPTLIGGHIPDDGFYA